MDSIEALTQKIARLSVGYKPNSCVSRYLSDKTVIPILGPFSTGKSTIMRKMEELDEEVSYVLGFTTRARRPREPDGIYRFIEHTPKKLQGLIDQLSNRDLVQIAINPATQFIYGSDLDSYRTPYNVLDVYTTAIEEFKTLPFASIMLPVYIVAPVDQWLKRIEERQNGIQTASDIRKRWLEAKINLEWAIQHQQNINWVLNDNGNLDKAAQEIIDIARGVKAEGSYPSGAEVAQKMLDTALSKI